jgi:TonB family protein
MGRSAIYSAGLHLAIVLVAVFGLPWLFDSDEIIEATPVTIVSPDQLNEMLKESKVERKREQEEPPKPPKPPEPPKPEEVKAPEPPAPQPEPVTPPEPEVVEPEPVPEPVIAEPESLPQEPEPLPAEQPQKVAVAKPVPPQKPKPPKKNKKKVEEKPKEEPADSMSVLLDKLNKQQEPAPPQPTQEAAVAAEEYTGPPLSEGEKDMIREQIEQNWLVDVGMQGIEEMSVDIRVRMNPDGSVQSAAIDNSSNTGHPNWPILAESALRAVYKSSPLRMPPEKPYEAWATMTLHFDARQMLGL